MEGRTPAHVRAGAYGGGHFACLRPVTGADQLRALLES